MHLSYIIPLLSLAYMLCMGQLPIDIQDQDLSKDFTFPSGAVLSFELYPNPAKDKLSIIFEHSTDQPMKVEVLDLLGNVVATYQFKHTDQQHTFPMEVSMLQEGIYFVRVYQHNNSLIKRLKVIN